MSVRGTQTGSGEGQDELAHPAPPAPGHTAAPWGDCDPLDYLLALAFVGCEQARAIVGESWTWLPWIDVAVEVLGPERARKVVGEAVLAALGGET